VRLTLLALRNGRLRPRLFELIAEAMRTLREELRGPAVIPALARLARYAVELDDLPPAVVREAFARVLVSEDRSDVMVSTADQMRAEWARETLLEQLGIKFGTIDASIRARVEQGSLEQVKAWLLRFVVASTPEEIFES
jgi:hypothetical protein